MTLFAEIGIPISSDELSQTVEVRRIQELEPIRLACRRHTDADVEELRRCLDDCTVAIAAGRSIAALDRVFHCGSSRPRNTILMRLVNIFYLMTKRRREYFFQDPGRRRQSDAERREIFAALVERDEQHAVQLLDAHLESADSYWQGLLRN